MALTASELGIIRMQLEIDALQAKLDKKKADNRTNTTLDEEMLYAKKLALAKELEK